jgi:hypothetical protein
MSLYDNVMAWMNGPSGPGTAYPWMADPVGQAGMYYAQGGYNSIKPPVQEYLSGLPTDPFAGQKGFWEDLPTDAFAGQKGFWETDTTPYQLGPMGQTTPTPAPSYVPPDPAYTDPNYVPDLRQWGYGQVPGSQEDVVPPNTWPEVPPEDYDDFGVYADRTIPEYTGPTGVPESPPDPYLEYPEKPEPAFGPDDDLMQAAIIQGDLMAQEEAAKRAFEMAHQAQPDPFAGWMEDYNAQTEKMVADAEEAHRRGLWLNLGKSFLSDPGNWGASMGGAMDALNQYNYAKAGLSTLEAEREKELLDSTLVYSQIGKNKASADADPRSWAEKKFDTQLQIIGEGLVSGRYDEATAQAALESILGMGQEYSVLDGVGVIGLGPTGEPTLNGKPITSEELGRLTQAAAAAKAQIGPQVKSDRQRAETEARIRAIQAKNPKMDSGTAGTYASIDGWRIFADMDVYNKEMENRGMSSAMDSITSSVTTMQKEIIDWLEQSRGVPLTPEQREVIEGLEDAEIERIMQEIQNEQ